MEVVRSPKWENVFTAQTATTAAPTLVSQGIQVPIDRRGKVVIGRLRHTATGARTCTIKLYGWCPGERDARGDDIDSTTGWDELLVDDYSLSSVAANGSVTAFVLESPTAYERIYARITAISGTSATLGFALAFTQEA